MTKNDWERKVRALFLKAQSTDSVDESASCLAMAQSLMEKHNIEEIVLQEEEEGEEHQQTPIVRKKVYDRKAATGKTTIPTWLLNICGGAAEANRCKYWYNNRRKDSRRGWEGWAYIEAAGTESNLYKMELLIPWLVGEVERLWKEEKPSYLSKSEGRRAACSFRLGASQTIRSRLIQAKKEAQEEMKKEAMVPEEKYKLAMENGDMDTIMEMDRNPEASKPKYALARITTAIAILQEEEKRTHEWVKENMKFRRGVARNFTGSSWNSYNAGRKAGQRANISGPKGRI